MFGLPKMKWYQCSLETPGGLPSWLLWAGALISGNSRGLPAWVRCMRCSRRLPIWALQLLWVSQCDRLDSYSQRSTVTSASAASQQHPCGSDVALERNHPQLPLTPRESKSTQQRAGIFLIWREWGSWAGALAQTTTLGSGGTSPKPAHSCPPILFRWGRAGRWKGRLAHHSSAQSLVLFWCAVLPGWWRQCQWRTHSCWGCRSGSGGWRQGRCLWQGGPACCWSRCFLQTLTTHKKKEICIRTFVQSLHLFSEDELSSWAWSPSESWLCSRIQYKSDGTWLIANSGPQEAKWMSTRKVHWSLIVMPVCHSKNPILEFIKKNQKGIISMALSRVS